MIITASARLPTHNIYIYILVILLEAGAKKPAEARLFETVRQKEDGAMLSGEGVQATSTPPGYQVLK